MKIYEIRIAFPQKHNDELLNWNGSDDLTEPNLEY